MKTHPAKSVSTHGLMAITVICLVAVAGTLTVLFGQAAVGDCTVTVTPTNFRSVFQSAGANSVVCLSAGSYSTDYTVSAVKTGNVTIKPAPGVARSAVTMDLDFRPAVNITVDGVTITNLQIYYAETKNVTIKNNDIPGQVRLQTDQLQNANILFDNNIHRDWVKCDNGCAEGRFWLPGNTSQPSGITIQNSEFTRGMSDGIANGSNGTRIINNRFHDLVSDGVTVHLDAIQLLGSKNTLIKGNHFYNLAQGVPAIQGGDGADHEIIEDNVMDINSSYPFSIILWSDDSSIVRHNTMVASTTDCNDFPARRGIITLGHKSAGFPDAVDMGHDTIIQDNILGEISIDQSGANFNTAESKNNLVACGGGRFAGDLAGRPTFTGGTNPATFTGHILAANSLGKGNASDGLDRGVRFGTTPPPTPTIGELDASPPVNGHDLSLLLSKFNQTYAQYDLDSTPPITGHDLSLLLSNWGR